MKLNYLIIIFILQVACIASSTNNFDDIYDVRAGGSDDNDEEVTTTTKRNSRLSSTRVPSSYAPTPKLDEEKPEPVTEITLRLKTKGRLKTKATTTQVPPTTPTTTTTTEDERLHFENIDPNNPCYSISSASSSSHASSSTNDFNDIYDVRASVNDDHDEEVTTTTKGNSRFSRTRVNRSTVPTQKPDEAEPKPVSEITPKPYAKAWFNPTKPALIPITPTITTEDDNYKDASVGCGISKIGNQMIYGGRSVTRASYPWNVALINKGKLICGATLVSNNTVVTAAHCIKGKAASHEYKAGDILALLGVHDLSDPYERRRIILGIKSIHLHQDWNINVESFDADVAILELESSVSFDNYIQPICLAGPESPVASIQNGIVVGFGRSENTDSENIAKMLDIPIHDYHTCTRSEQHKHLLSSRTFCGGPGGGQGVCNGDSGSGVYVLHENKFYLRGIVSSALLNSLNQCNVQTYSVFTKVTDFYTWITSDGITKYENQCFNLKNENARLKELLRRNNIKIR